MVRSLYDEAAGGVTTTLQQDYFGLDAIAEGDGAARCRAAA